MKNSLLALLAFSKASLQKCATRKNRNYKRIRYGTTKNKERLKLEFRLSGLIYIQVCSREVIMDCVGKIPVI